MYSVYRLVKVMKFIRLSLLAAILAVGLALQGCKTDLPPKANFTIDGFHEFVVGIRKIGDVYILTGSSGTVLHTTDFENFRIVEAQK